MTLAHATQELRAAATAADDAARNEAEAERQWALDALSDEWRRVAWERAETAREALLALLTPTTVLALLDRLERAERHVDPANVVEMLRFMGHDRAAELVRSSFVAEVTPRAALDDEAPR